MADVCVRSCDVKLCNGDVHDYRRISSVSLSIRWNPSDGYAPAVVYFMLGSVTMVPLLYTLDRVAVCDLYNTYRSWQVSYAPMIQPCNSSHHYVMCGDNLMIYWTLSSRHWLADQTAQCAQCALSALANWTAHGHCSRRLEIGHF